jgi:SHS2 domain-containing protein
MGHYRYIEDVAIADCAVEIEGDGLDDVFETSAAALAAIMVDPATVPLAIERTLTLSAEAEDLLLYDWLAELILRKDRDREVFPVAEVHVEPGSPCTLRARVRGCGLDAAALQFRNDAKAVTLHAFALERTPAGWRARVVIDI